MSRDHDDVLSPFSAASDDNPPNNAKSESATESASVQKEALCPLCSYLPFNNSSQSTAGTKSADAAGSLHDDPKTVILDHIADHLQFLSLLTPRLLIEKLDNSTLKDFSSSKATSRNGTEPTLRSTRGAFPETPEDKDEDAIDEVGLLNLDDAHHPNEVPPDSALDVWSGVIFPDALPSKDKFLEDLIQSGAFHSHRVKSTPPQVSILSLEFLNENKGSIIDRLDLAFGRG